MDEKICWPGWEIAGAIGKGANGAVYEIRREVFGTVERAALKVISVPKDEGEIAELIAEGYDSGSIVRRYQKCLEDIVKEYSIMARMKGNSNIVDCDDVRYVPKGDGYGWTVLIKMELLEPLMKSLDADVPEAEVLRLGLDIGSALVVCRDQNIIHRDIKPQNIFRSKYGGYKLGDFGVAKISDKTSSGTIAGTYRFMAPEVFTNQPYNSAADIYSLGLVMYWMLNEKRMPFMPLPPAVPTDGDEETARVRRMRGEPLPLPAHGSSALKKVVMKMCAFAPWERYDSPEKLLEDLEAVRSGACDPPGAQRGVQRETEELARNDETVLLSPETSPFSAGTAESASPPKRRGRRIWPVAAAAVVVVVAALGLMLFRGGHAPERLPSQLEAMRDVSALLKADGVSGALTDLVLRREQQFDSYGTCVREYEATVADGGAEYVHHVRLVYELDADGWHVSGLSGAEQ